MKTHVVSEKAVAATRAVIGIVARVSLGLTTVAVTAVVHRSASRCPMLWLLLFVVKVAIADAMAIHAVDSTPPQRAATLAIAVRCWMSILGVAEVGQVWRREEEMLLGTVTVDVGGGLGMGERDWVVGVGEEVVVEAAVTEMVLEEVVTVATMLAVVKGWGGYLLAVLGMETVAKVVVIEGVEAPGGDEILFEQVRTGVGKVWEAKVVGAEKGVVGTEVKAAVVEVGMEEVMNVVAYGSTFGGKKEVGMVVGCKDVS
ncbi:hypothetical protein CYMTET_55419 [Cymbomonas tetramitiformis]|uniref:Uncharacterized protein n=1 Tax=Cymbomonas tetramitiformis TaxID=36881 RepID=A0AAE0BE78_9CHLO|nr:hypothetical protein CYMTET_55419 [Cymbomonas tetramitiformis]